MPYAWVYPVLPVCFDSKFHAYQTVAQSIPNGAFTIMDFHAELFDGLSEFNLATNRFQPIKNGYYLLIASVQIVAAVDQKVIEALMRLNGVTWIATFTSVNSGVSPPTARATVIRYLLSTDYVEALAYQNTGVARNTEIWNYMTYFCGHRLS